MDTREAIEAFWSWWTANRPLLEREVATAGAAASFIEPLSARVRDIDPDLEWEFGRGMRAQHQLCLSSKGRADLRVLAERWRAGGPGDDEVFEFHCARQQTPGDPSNVVLKLQDHHFGFEDLRFSVSLDDQRQRFLLDVHHPIFAEVPEGMRATLMFISLDNLVGEDAVETWLGALHPSPDPAPEDAIGPAILRRLVDGAQDRWPEHSWAVYQGSPADRPETTVILKACASHKYLLDPLFDTLALVRIPYEGEAGMPDEPTHARLESFWDAVADELGDDARLLAQQTGDELRLVWCYLRGADGPARHSLERLVAQHPGATLTVSWDPGWKQLPI